MTIAAIEPRAIRRTALVLFTPFGLLFGAILGACMGFLEIAGDIVGVWRK